jgi:threonylcarbamoyladenosine tRNA methylthiotransferase MtaB
MTAKPDVVTLGCRLNAFESEVMRRNAETAGLTDAVIVNTCAVTREAERQSRQAIRKLKRERPGARIIVTGCAAQLHPERFAAMAEVDRVLGNIEKLDPAAFAPGADAPVAVSDIMAARDDAPHLFSGALIEDFGPRARAFVQIQQGCDHRCTFCIIPFARGRSVSLGADRIVEQVRLLVEAGYAEVVLTGVDISSYGRDIGEDVSLGRLVVDLLARVPELQRLRLSSLDPAVVDEDLIEALGREPRLMPHLHLSLQAGEDMVLKRMKRRHLTADAVALCERLRAVRPDLVLGADLIAGFPTETDGQFALGLDHIEELGTLGLVHLHVFPYSAHDGTPSARMPQVPMPVRKRRAAILRDLGERLLQRDLERRIGSTARVLVEADNAGRSEHYLQVRLDGLTVPGDIVAARVMARDGGILVGAPVA